MEPGEESDGYLLSIKSERWLQAFVSGSQKHCGNLQQKKQNGKGVCGREKERRDKLYWRQLCWQQREVSRQQVSVSGPTQDISRGEAKPIRVADCTVWTE